MVMASDPWNSNSFDSGSNQSSFEDNFVRAPLPDSSEYLARLERKLARVKNNGKSIVESLEERKRDCVVRLLTEDITLEETVDDEDIPTKWLKSYINPQQPLTVGELVELVKADHLEQATAEANRESENGENQG